MAAYEKESAAVWIMDALLRLLKKREYASITVQNIADEAKIGRRTFYRYYPSRDAVLTAVIRRYLWGLGDYFAENLSDRREDISLCYFSYWEQNIEFLLTMQKAGLTYRIAEHFEEAVHEIARRLGHVPSNADRDSMMKYQEQYKFAFGFRLAGYWKVTELWSQESSRRSAGEMSRIVNEILAPAVGT